jgi:hypothetical protein
MKLRLEPGSIRIRLNEQDLDAWRLSDTLSESLELGNRQVLRWELLKTRGLEALTVDFDQCAIRITVPFAAAESWLGSEATGLGEFIDVHGHGALQVVVERDLKTKTPRNAR